MGSTYLALAQASVRAHAGRPVLLVLRFVGQGFGAVIEVAGVVIVLQRFHRLAGWDAAQVALLIAVGQLALGLVGVVVHGVENPAFSELIRRGAFDQVLARPGRPLGWLLTVDVRPSDMGRATASVAVLVWAGGRAHVSWTPAHVGVACLAVSCCAAIVLSLQVLGAALTFFTVQGSEVANTLTFGGLNLSFYPLQIYDSALRFVFLWVVPMALAVYVPVLTLVGRTGPPGVPRALLAVTPAATAAFTMLAALGWRAGIRHYTGTGS